MKEKDSNLTIIKVVIYINLKGSKEFIPIF
jgi:hypothetical protein